MRLLLALLDHVVPLCSRIDFSLLLFLFSVTIQTRGGALKGTAASWRTRSGPPAARSVFLPGRREGNWRVSGAHVQHQTVLHIFCQSSQHALA